MVFNKWYILYRIIEGIITISQEIVVGIITIILIVMFAILAISGVITDSKGTFTSKNDYMVDNSNDCVFFLIFFNFLKEKIIAIANITDDAAF